MTTPTLWICDDDADQLIGADGYPHEFVNDEGQPVTLFLVSDSQIQASTPGSITRMLVVADGEGELWGTVWMAVSTGTPGFTWNEALTKPRAEVDFSTTRTRLWVGFRPVKSAQYAFEEETS